MQAETLLSLPVSVAGEQSVQGVLDRIVRGLSKQPELALRASGSFGPAIFAMRALCVQIGAGSLPTHRSPRGCHSVPKKVPRLR
jgi:hypothetical protein